MPEVDSKSNPIDVEMVSFKIILMIPIVQLTKEWIPCGGLMHLHCVDFFFVIFVVVITMIVLDVIV